MSIASNILADRLKRLTEQGIISKADDPTHKQKAIYSLTEQGIELLPVLAQMSVWDANILPSPRSFRSARNCSSKAAQNCGPTSWRNCARRISAQSGGDASVDEKLRAAYEAVVAKRKSG